MNKKTTWIIGIILIVLILILVNNNSTKDQTSGSIKLGVITPATGPAGQMGEEVLNSLKLASITNVTMSFEDDQCSGKQAVSSYNKLKSEGVHIFYVACSGSVLALAPLAKEDGNLILTAYAGSSEIRKTGDEVIRFIPDAVSIANAMAEYTISLRDVKKIGLLYENQDYSKSAAMILKDKTGTLISEEETYSAEDTSFRTQITKLKANGVDTLLYVPTSDKAAKLVYAEMKNLSYKPYIIGDVNVCEYPFSPKDYGMKSTCFDSGFNIETQAYKDFILSYQTVYGHPASAGFYDAVTYDIVKILDAYKSTKKTVKVDDLKKYILAGVKGEMTDYAFTSEGEVLGSNYLKQINK